MAPQILEGTWEEITQHAPEFLGRRIRVTILPDEPRQPNQAMLEAMQKIAARNKDKPLTSGEDTQQLLREARDGGMFGYESDE